MPDNKKYYYLKLKDGFFDSEKMIILESLDDGYIYSNIYMKLLVRSLKGDGRLMFNDRIPYSPTLLAQITRHSVGDIERAIKIFKEFDLIEIMDNGAIYMLDVQNYVGRSSSEADRQRLYQKKIKDSNGLDPLLLECKKSNKKSNKKSTPEKEIEKETETDIDSQQVADKWNEIVVSLPKVIKVSESRKKAIKSKKCSLDEFINVFKKVEQSEFLSGRNGKWQMCSFDWVLKSGNWLKIIEGNYEKRKAERYDKFETLK